MSKAMLYISRWIALLPGAIIAGILSTFLLHFVLYVTLTKFINPYPEFPERALTPFIVALTFIWSGGEIAPSHKIRAAIVFFSIWMFIAGGFIMTEFTKGDWLGKTLSSHSKGISPLFGIAGAFVGLYLVWKKNTSLQKQVTVLEDEKDDW